MKKNIKDIALVALPFLFLYACVWLDSDVNGSVKIFRIVSLSVMQSIITTLKIIYKDGE